MKRTEYIREKDGLIQEIPIKEIKYSGSITEEVNAYISVFPRVVIYETESEDDATYIFLTKEKMECFLAITLAEYFSSEVVRKRADFDKNMCKYSSLFKRIVLKANSDNEWSVDIDFYTNKRIANVLGHEEEFCLSKAIKAFCMDMTNLKTNESLFQKLPYINIQKNGVGWSELCFPAFANDVRYSEVESNLSGCRFWYNEPTYNEFYKRFSRYNSKIKLCTYGNKFTHSDIVLFNSIITK